MDSSTSTSTSPTESYHKHCLPIPEMYQFIEVLGQGSFGKVVKCVKQGTDQTVAIKIAKHHHDPRQEAAILKFLMQHNMYEFNIVRFYGEFIVKRRIGLVFEMLDISLQEYLLSLEDFMSLEDIRSVMEQMATAFSGLKRIGVIHTDVKMDNIMVVVRQPLRVKLIDFGLALFRYQAKPGWALQTPSLRAPEIMLALPYSEGIDIWSLGCVMAIMVFGFTLFPGRFDYDALRFIIDLLGPPPDRLLDAGRKSKMFFKKTDNDQWLLMTPEEYWGPTIYSTDDRCYTFRSLDEVKTMLMESDDVTEADEMWECIDLLKAILTWDASERITPSGILNHPFITLSYLSSSPHFSSCLEAAAAEPGTSEAKTRTNEAIEKDDGTRESESSDIFNVLPAAPKNSIDLEESSDLKSESNLHTAAAPVTTLDATRIHPGKRDPPPTDTDKKREKTNGFKRVFSWIKKTFCCCWNMDDMDIVQE